MFSAAYCWEIQGYFEDRMTLLQDRGIQLRETGGMLSGEGSTGKPFAGRTASEALERPLTGKAPLDKTVPGNGRELYAWEVALLGQKLEEIRETLGQCTQEEREALWFLYSASPLSDMLDYPAALFLAYARHGVFLWNQGPYAGKVPEKLFANYVLHHRVHNEDVADTRRFFYDMLYQRTAGKDMYDAVLEANCWCGEQVTYQSTYLRTQNPLTMYGTGAGRCGEGAPFAVTALRSIGIPAREVYAPWWAHCDDNHAWIEAWCDGKWYFTGGGEPEERLDEGWFVGPCSRAMLISSRWFGKDTPLEPVVGHGDLSVGLNHLDRYAPTTTLTVKVEDGQGRAVPGARVEFCLPNYGRINAMATRMTGADPGEEDYGMARLDTGYGSLLVCASWEDCYGEVLVDLSEAGEGMTCCVVLGKSLPCLGQWRNLQFVVPREAVRDETRTGEQAARQEARAEHAARCRQKRMDGFYQEPLAKRVLARFTGEDREKIQEILKQAKGNMAEIVRFLEWDFAGQTMALEQQYGRERWKRKALEVLTPNEYWDIKAEVLVDSSICAAPYAGSVPQEVFFQDLLNPCTGFERARAHRRALSDCLEQGTKEEIRRDPRSVAGILQDLVKTYPQEEYANLVISPMGCLTGGIGSELSGKVLCVNLLRALGIPARIGRMDRTLEYYASGRFVPLVQTDQTGKTGMVILKNGENIKVQDWRHYSLSRYEKGHFVPLFLGARNPGSRGSRQEEGRDAWEGGLELNLEEGIYRIVTTNRLLNGGQFVRLYDFALEAGERKEIVLSLQEASVEEMLERMPVDDIALQTHKGEQMSLSSLAGKGRALFLWLDLTREPSEHILNELYEKREAYREILAPVHFVVRRGAKYREDPTLARTCEALPGARVLLDDFGETYRQFSRQVGRNPGKLPLAAVLDGGRVCVYSDAGYNVGMADTLLHMLL